MELLTNPKLLLLMLFPALVLVGLALSLWMHWNMWRESRSRLVYDDLDTEPLAPNELPRAAREYLDRHTPEFTWLGFRALGDFRLKGYMFVRRFLSADGRTAGEIVLARLGWLLKIRTYDYFSVLADGTYVESAAMSGPEQEPEVAKRFVTNPVPRATPQELLEAHRDCVGQLAAERGCDVLPLDENSIRAAATYGHHLVQWSRRCAMDLDTTPPEFPLAVSEAGEPDDSAETWQDAGPVMSR